MYTPYKREEKGVTYYYGSIGKGVYFDADEIRVLKDTGSSIEANERDRLLDFDTNTYIYIPSIHRFGLLKTENTVTLTDFLKFLQHELPKLIDKEDNLSIDYERNSSIIKEVFNAETVYSLSYEISYTNNDALGAQGELFDEILKEGHVGYLKVEAKADHHENGLEIEKVIFLNGGLELAKNNGIIKKAKILPKGAKKTKILTNTETPKIETFEVTENQNENRLWFSRFLDLFKAGEV